MRYTEMKFAHIACTAMETLVDDEHFVALPKADGFRMYNRNRVAEIANGMF